MAVDLEDLVPALRVAVNPPGRALVTASTTEWLQRLAGAFWMAKVNGFFTGYRVDIDGGLIVNVADPDDGPDLDEDLQHIVVMWAAVEAIELRLANLPHSRRVKAGPVESESASAATVLVELLRARRRDLEGIRDRLVDKKQDGTAIAVIDLLESRIDGCGLSYAWAR